MALEVERKYRTADHGAVRAKVESLGGVWAEPITQSDHYFAHPLRDFAATDEALRIRSVGAKNVMTYKGPKIDRHSKTREEMEVSIGEGEAASNDMAQILEKLGFRTVLVVSKSRSIAEIHWQGRDVEAALDEVAGAGRFVELETQADEAELEEAKACIGSLAEQLGLSETDQERRSYLELVLTAGREKN